MNKNIGASGNEVQVSNRSDFNEAVANIHNASSPVDWILVNYDGSPNQVKLEGSGTGGINELLGLLDDGKMSYALIRVVDKVDGIPTNRFVYITWIGEDVKGIEKARYGTNKSSITKLIGHYNVEVAASLKSEISEQELMNRVQDASGSRNRTGDVTSQQPTVSRYGSSTTSTLKQPAVTTVKVPSANTSNVGLTFNNESHLKQLIQDVKDGKNPTNWLLVGYQGKDQIGFVASGTGGIEELADNLQDSEIQYGIVKTADKIDQSTTQKYAQINWVGVNVSPMVKVRLAHKGTIDEFFAPVHITLFAENRSELSESVLQAKVQALKGNKITQ